MTYDPLEVLRAFHDKHQLGYPLLHDQDARHVQAYGVLNPEYQPGHRAYGIPLPGVLLVAPDGRVLAKYAVPGYRERPEFAGMYADVVRRLGAPEDG